MKVNIYDLMENIEDSSVRMEDNSVVSSERIKELTRMKIQNASNKKRSSKKTILTVGIAVAVVAALGATAFAAINGGLANLSFGKSSWGPSIEEDIKNSVPPREFVSSQGYPDSPEYQATKEWIAFDDSYDREFKILDAFDAETKRTGTDPFAEKYGDYGVYSQEMADKIDEICAKYKLKLHTGCDDADEKILEEEYGVDLFADGVEGGGYQYDDGTFQLDSTFNGINFQIRRCMKGYFDTVYLNAGSIEKYEQWTYTTKSGVTVNIAYNPTDNGFCKAIISVNLENSFVSINVLPWDDNGELRSVSKEDVENLAEQFHFENM